MATDPPIHNSGDGPEAVEMPRPTIAPFVLSAGMILMAAGVALSPLFYVVGGLLLFTGLGLWIGSLLPGRGHFHESFVGPDDRAKPVSGEVGTVDRLQAGMPGYRMRLPQDVHPISAGVKGGIVGGLIIPIPAILWGLFSGHGIWYPVNLLAGMVLPGVETMSIEQLETFSFSLLLVGLVIHVVTSVVVGLLYGVLLPTLPNMPRPLAWGGLLMPLLWTGVSFLLLQFINPLLATRVDWPWFIVSQFVFGVVAAAIVVRYANLPPVWAGLLGGLVGGLVMPLPAILWGLATRHGIWYPINLLAGTIRSGLGEVSVEELQQFHADWLTEAIIIHAIMCAGFGLVYGFLLPRLKPIPGPIAWGGLLMPLLWTGASYSLMGVVNPLLQQRVDWPWFIVSQFVFGIAASIVVERSEKVHIAPAGPGSPTP
jgi:hypothetical protein